MTSGSSMGNTRRSPSALAAAALPGPQSPALGPQLPGQTPIDAASLTPQSRLRCLMQHLGLAFQHLSLLA